MTTSSFGSGFHGITPASCAALGQPISRYEMEVIAMAILGGASPSGGKGRVGGVIVGVFTIGLIRYGTGLVNVSAETLKVIIGILLIVVCAAPNMKQVLADAKESRRGKRQLVIKKGGT